MAVAFDAVGPSSSGAQSASSATLSWTHTGSGSALLVGVSVDDGSDVGTTCTATCDAVAMTSLGRVESGTGAIGFLQVFAAAGLGGSSHAIVVTHSHAPTDMEGGSLSFTGAASTVGAAFGGPATASQSSGTSASVTLSSSSSGNLVAGFLANGNSITSATSPATSRFINNQMGGSGNGTGNAAGSTSPAGGSVTMAWSTTAFSAVMAVEVKAPSVTAPNVAPAAVQTSRTWQRRWTRTVRPPIPPQVAQVAPHAGVAAVSAVAVPVPSARYITGTALASGGTKAWFTDQNGAPRPYFGEDAWDVIINAGRWNGGNVNADIDTYLSTRSAQGYTAVEVQMFSSNNPNASYVFTDGRDWDGTYPFATTTDPTTAINSAFWAKRDYFFTKAQALGMSVVMNVTTSALGTAGNWILSWTTTQWQAYGTKLGTRYTAQPNILWIAGDDYFGTIDSALGSWRTSLRAAGGGQLISIQNYQEATSRVDIFSATKDPNAFDVHAQYEWGYSYNPSYDVVEKAQTYVPSASDDVQSLVPPIWADGFYANSGTSAGQTWQRLLRQNIWWALSSGGGYATGDNNIFPWGNGSAAQMTGSFYTGVVAPANSFFGSLPGWHKLVADTGSALVTAGRGTHVTPITSGGGGSPYIGNTDNYVTASRAPDGSLAVIYGAQGFSITIDQTKMASGYTVTWYDPASGATSTGTAGSTYNSATAVGNNSAGDPDWVLVLQAPAAASATAGVAAVSVAAPQAVPAVAVTAGVATVSAVAPAAQAAEGAKPAAAAVSAVAPAPSVAETVTAAVAVVSAVAPAPADAEAVTAGAAVVSAVAPAPVPAVAVFAGVAVVNAVAPAATVSTSGGTTAPAGVAVVSVIAPAASVAETVTAGAAAVSAVAPAPSVAETVTAAVAVVSAVAPAPADAEAVTAAVAVVSAVARAAQAAIVVNAGVAVVGAVAPAATVSTSGSTNAVAGAAAVQAIAPAPSPAVVVFAGVAAIQAVAPAATAASGKIAAAGVATVQSLAMASASLAATAAAQAALVLAAGVDVPPVFTKGTLTATDAPLAVLTAADGTSNLAAP